jgi:hypothetical protein
MGQQQQQGQYRQYNQQQYGHYNQQQYGQYNNQQQYSRLPGRAFKPPPPPVERFGPAFNSRGYGCGPVVLRSLLWETAYGCQVRCVRFPFIASFEVLYIFMYIEMLHTHFCQAAMAVGL